MDDRVGSRRRGRTKGYVFVGDESEDLSADHIALDAECPVGGINLRTTPKTSRACDVFDPDELEERIRRISARVHREEVVTPDDAKRRRTGREGNIRRRPCPAE